MPGPLTSPDVSPRPWYFDGRDIFSVQFGDGGHRLVIPLPEPVWHPSQRVSDADARFVVEAVNAHERLVAALKQACTILATIRPLDVIGEGETDVSVGEAAERWEALIYGMVQSANGQERVT